jgi:hypothetical protein
VNFNLWKKRLGRITLDELAQGLGAIEQTRSRNRAKLDSIGTRFKLVSFA